MVSEGVDVPRLRVGVYATTARTELFFRQVIGRFIRRTPAPKDQMSHVFLPSDPKLKRLAVADRGGAQPRAGVRAAAARRSPSAASAPRPARPSARCGRARAATRTSCRRPSPATRCSSSPSPSRRRWPRSRSPRRPPCRPSPRRRSSGASACAPSATRWSARSRAATGEAHAQVNARINRQVGAESVNKSTDEQLEKANRLLEKEVARGGSLAGHGRAAGVAGRDGRGAVDRGGCAARDPGLDRDPARAADDRVRAVAAAGVAGAAAGGPALRADRAGRGQRGVHGARGRRRSRTASGSRG